MIIIFLMYDNEVFCARYIYKCDNFYILTVIVTKLGFMECENKKTRIIFRLNEIMYPCICCTVCHIHGTM
jgi:hypothetical protein